MGAGSSYWVLSGGSSGDQERDPFDEAENVAEDVVKKGLDETSEVRVEIRFGGSGAAPNNINHSISPGIDMTSPEVLTSFPYFDGQPIYLKSATSGYVAALVVNSEQLSVASNDEKSVSSTWIVEITGARTLRLCNARVSSLYLCITEDLEISLTRENDMYLTEFKWVSRPNGKFRFLSRRDNDMSLGFLSNSGLPKDPTESFDEDNDFMLINSPEKAHPEPLLLRQPLPVVDPPEHVPSPPSSTTSSRPGGLQEITIICERLFVDDESSLEEIMEDDVTETIQIDGLVSTSKRCKVVMLREDMSMRLGPLTLDFTKLKSWKNLKFANKLCIGLLFEEEYEVKYILVTSNSGARSKKDLKRFKKIRVFIKKKIKNMKMKESANHDNNNNNRNERIRKRDEEENSNIEIKVEEEVEVEVNRSEEIIFEATRILVKEKYFQKIFTTKTPDIRPYVLKNSKKEEVTIRLARQGYSMEVDGEEVDWETFCHFKRIHYGVKRKGMALVFDDLKKKWEKDCIIYIPKGNNNKKFMKILPVFLKSKMERIREDKEKEESEGEESD